MATYVKGEAVANATSYELLEKSSGDYNSLATANEINFDVSALELSGGDHVLVVKAHADGYESSDLSNEVIYVVPMGAYWVNEKLSGGTIGTGAGSSFINTQWFYLDDAAYVAELAGKTVKSMAFNSGDKATSGKVFLYLVDLSNPSPASWEEKISFEVSITEDTIHKMATVDLETPFTVPTGHTIGFRSSTGHIFGGGTLIDGYTITGKYYASSTAETASNIGMAGVDFKVE